MQKAAFPAAMVATVGGCAAVIVLRGGRRAASTSASAATAASSMSKGWRVKHMPNPRPDRAAEYPPHLPIQPSGHATAKASITSWPGYKATPLVSATTIATMTNVSRVWLKDESGRFGMGSFKSLGGALVAADMRSGHQAKTSTAVCTASAGNHGVGLAWGARASQLDCHVFLPTAVPESQAVKIRGFGGTVHRISGIYEDALNAAKAAATTHGWQLVQDVSWPGYETVPSRIYEGYTVLAEEILQQLRDMDEHMPTHVLVNGGVGGLCSGVCAHLWASLGSERPRFVVVEPLCSACLMFAAETDGVNKLVHTDDTTVQVGLDCKEASPLCWQVLTGGTDDFVAVGDEMVDPCIQLLEDAVSPPILAGESAVAGVGVLLAAADRPALRDALGLTPDSRVAIIICEGRTHG